MTKRDRQREEYEVERAYAYITPSGYFDAANDIAAERELTQLRRDKAVADTALGVLREALGEPDVLLVEAAVKAAERIKQ